MIETRETETVEVEFEGDLALSSLAALTAWLEEFRRIYGSPANILALRYEHSCCDVSRLIVTVYAPSFGYGGGSVSMHGPKSAQHD